MARVTKTADWPYASRDDLDLKVAEFQQELASLEAQGWARDPEGITIYQDPSDLPRGWFRIRCVVLTPSDPDTPRLRRQRLDLRRVP